MIKYFHFLYRKMKKYDKNAQNPFYSRRINDLKEATYVWVEKPKGAN